MLLLDYLAIYTRDAFYSVIIFMVDNRHGCYNLSDTIVAIYVELIYRCSILIFTKDMVFPTK